jgi:hypothetical protein
MSHHHDHQEEKENTFLYAGGTGAFTIFWLLVVFTFLFCILYFG